MGTWSTSLYGSDFASDLQSTIKAVSRLPFDAPQLLNILRESVGKVADDAADEDYTNFWLVAADQFHKRGINAPIVFQTAIGLIDSGSDLEMLRSLGMSDPDLKKRSKVLAALREKIASPPPPKKRSTIATPEPFVMNPGDLLIYAVSKSGDARNPYMPDGLDDWEPDKWGACLVLRTGRAFGFFAWYQYVKLLNPQPQKPMPTPETLFNPNLNWCLAYPGTCSPRHFKRMHFAKLANFPLHTNRIHELVWDADIGADKIEDCAIEDRSIANDLQCSTCTGQRSLQGLAQLVRD